MTHWHGHHHDRDRHWHRHGRVNAWMLRRYLRRYGGDELRALEEYRRDIEQHLEDVSEQIRRLQEQRESSTS